jgi:hypothetical protein
MLVAGLVQAGMQYRQAQIAEKQASYQEKAGNRFADHAEYAGHLRARRLLAARQTLKAAGGASVDVNASDLQQRRNIMDSAKRQGFDIRFRAKQQADMLKNQAVALKVGSAVSALSAGGANSAVGLAFDSKYGSTMEKIMGTDIWGGGGTGSLPTSASIGGGSSTVISSGRFGQGGDFPIGGNQGGSSGGSAGGAAF